MTRGSTILLIFCLVLAAPTWLLVPLQLKYVSPELSIGLRFIIAFFAVEIFRRLKGEALPKLQPVDYVLIGLQGIFLYSINFYLCYESSNYMATGLIAATVSTMIIPNLLLGALILGNPVKFPTVLGGLIGLTGVILLFWNDFLNIQQGLGALQGFFLAFISTFFSVMGTMIAGRLLKRGVPLLFATSRAMLAGGLFSIGVGGVTGTSFAFTWNFEFLASLLYLALVVTTTVNVFYSFLVKEVGAGKASFMWIVMPALCLGLSVMYEDYEWTSYSNVGVILIMLGGIFTSFGKTIFKEINIYTKFVRGTL